MNTPNPLIPQGSLLEQQKSKGKSNLFIAVFMILAVHVVVFAGLLMQGCKPEKGAKKMEDTGLASSLSNSVQDTNILAPITPLPLPGAAASTVATDTNVQKPLPLAPATPITTPITTPAENVAATPATGKEYTVAKGDKLYTIAKVQGVSVKALADANPNVDPRKMHVGQKLIIPVSDTTPAATEPAAAKVSKSEGAYTVKPGDTLAKIARAHGTTIKAIRTNNNLKTDQLRPGQKLKLPAGKTAATSEAASSSHTNATKI